MNVWVRVSIVNKCEIKLDKQRCFTGHKIPASSWPNSFIKNEFRFEWNDDDGSQIVSITATSTAAVYYSCSCTRNDHHQHHRLEQQTHSTGYRFIASKITLIPDAPTKPRAASSSIYASRIIRTNVIWNLNSSAHANYYTLKNSVSGFIAANTALRQRPVHALNN